MSLFAILLFAFVAWILGVVVFVPRVSLYVLQAFLVALFFVLELTT